jgi:hypothetical protein
MSDRSLVGKTKRGQAGRGGVDWIGLAQDSNRCRTLIIFGGASSVQAPRAQSATLV